MKTRNTILAVLVLIAAASFTGCTKNMSLQERKDLSKGDLLHRWGFVYYINSNHDTVFAKNTPCLQDDQMIFYPNNVGHILQGSCIYYPGKAADVSFRFEQVGISRWKLTSWNAGVYPNGQTWFSEGSNNADLHGEEIPGEGTFLYIVETSPNYQEWKYKVLSD